MRIGILGSGLMGGKLGIIFARAGHDVVFSYARKQEKLKRLAREAGGGARAGTPQRRRRTRMPCWWPCTGPASTISSNRPATWRGAWSSAARCR
jgi:hypothetical protein